jgi:hypothetical protein
VPPDETVWRRYSQHHELPLSMTTSVAIHGICFALLALGVGIIILKPPVPLPPSSESVVEVGEGDNGGPDAGPLLPIPGKQEAAREPVERRPQAPVQPPAAFTRPKVPAEAADPRGDIRVSEDAKDATKRLEEIEKAARGRLLQGKAEKPGAGGIGRDGKQGGVGDRPGSGGPLRIDRVQAARADRWVMLFNTQDGADYLRQLAGLSAGMSEKTIVAVRQPDDRFLVFRDVSRQPSAGRVEDLGQFHLIRWQDEKPESVASLARALGLRFSPREVYVFFPAELEAKLLKLELDYRGRREEQIKETRFRIERRGGLYEPVVVAQEYK